MIEREKVILDQLRSMYDKKKIGDIERKLLLYRKNGNENLRDLVFGLFYLKSTERWKENRRFSDSTWENYITETSFMTKSSYDKYFGVFSYQHEYSIKFSPDIVLEVFKKCGPMGTMQTFKKVEIQFKNKATKNITRSNILSVAEEFAKEPKRRPRRNYVSQVKNLKLQISELEDLLKEKDDLITEQTFRIEKLRKSLMDMEMKKRDLEKSLAIKDSEISNLQNQLTILQEGLKRIINP